MASPHPVVWLKVASACTAVLVSCVAVIFCAISMSSASNDKAERQKNAEGVRCGGGDASYRVVDEVCEGTNQVSIFETDEDSFLGSLNAEQTNHGVIIS